MNHVVLISSIKQNKVDTDVLKIFLFLSIEVINIHYRQVYIYTCLIFSYYVDSPDAMCDTILF